MTGDNYILKVTRIINPYIKDKSSLRPILLRHGFQCNANTWVINSEGKLTQEGKYVEDKTQGPVANTLGFVLAVNGFDVWLANMRGTAYSTNHTKLSAEGESYLHQGDPSSFVVSCLTFPSNRSRVLALFGR